jgi:hypothetical protein
MFRVGLTLVLFPFFLHMYDYAVLDSGYDYAVLDSGYCEASGSCGGFDPRDA